MLAHNIEHSHRKERRFAPWILGGGVALLVLISIISVFWYQGTIKAPNKGTGAETAVTISSGEGLEKIAKDLKSQKLISNVFVFELYMKAAGQSGKIQAGEYKIPGNLNMKSVAEIITIGKVVVNRITIPEGWDIDKIGTYLAAHTTITKAQFETAAAYDPAKYSYPFLSGMKKGDSLEGFLYPDTYMISLTPTADEVVGKMLKNFDKKLTSADRSTIAKSNMTTKEVVTLASIVEAEVANTADRKLVASVFLNRLNAGMPLESDATVAYSLKTGNKRLTYEQTHTSTPYNTYLNVGLPIGPIGNPSIDSIEAVIYPTKSSYYYFISVGTKTFFAQTLAEHNALVAKYLD